MTSLKHRLFIPSCSMRPLSRRHWNRRAKAALNLDNPMDAVSLRILLMLKFRFEDPVVSKAFAQEPERPMTSGSVCTHRVFMSTRVEGEEVPTIGSRARTFRA